MKHGHLTLRFTFALNDENTMACSGAAESLLDLKARRDLKDYEDAVEHVFPVAKIDITGLDSAAVARIQNKYAMHSCLKHFGFKLEKAPEPTGLVDAAGEHILK